MKQEIIDQMRAELSSSRLCHLDFEKYDLEILNKDNSPFFWVVRQNGTSLTQIGPECHFRYFTNEYSRISFMRDTLTVLSVILYWSEETAKYFYYDGWKLHKINKDEMREIYLNIWEPTIKEMVAAHPEEAEVANKPIEVIICESAIQSLEEAKEYAKSIGDSSLEDCLDRFTHYNRIAVNHRVEIYNDFTKYGFGFTEYVNEEPRLTGGILYSEGSEKHWSIHT